MSQEAVIVKSSTAGINRIVAAEGATSGATTAPPQEITRAAWASVIGSVVEWYDFYLYGTAAALVFNRLFFPNFDPLSGTLLAFSTYAIGFFVRPLGGIIFGRLGDRVGRKRVLVLTLLMMGLSTTAIGLLPTYNTLGVWAPLLLLLLRMIQGVAAGAEFTGAILLIGEFSPRERRGYFTSLPGAGISVGILLSAGVFALFTMLPEAEFNAWGWRAPFLLSAIVVVIGVIVRRAVPETPEFVKLLAAQKASRTPIADLFRLQPKELVLAFGMRIAENGSAYILQVFVLTYLVSYVKVPASVGLTATLIAAGASIVAIPLWGMLADRIGARWVYFIGATFFAVFSFPYFYILKSGDTGLIIAAVVVSVVFSYCALVGSQPSLFISIFKPQSRFSGISLAREFSAPVAGGLAPLIASALLSAGGGSPSWVALYVTSLGAISAVCVLLLPRRLTGDDAPSDTQKDVLS
jgi:MFS transporter, MHS family, shikimate and dehydroshikimate transport protein